MEKPIILKLEETRQRMAEVINTSDLPPSLLKPIIKDIYEEINFLYNQELEEAKKKQAEEDNKEEEK